MRILIVGAGAVGGYFGGRLAEAGRDITFLVRADQARAITEHGLRIVSPHGDATLHPHVLLTDGLKAPYDLILLGVKAYSLPAAMDDFAGAVGPDTIILPLLNGMRHIDLLSARFGEKAVVGGACLIAADVASDRRIVQLTSIHRLIYGERGGGLSARMQLLDKCLQGATFEARLSENILQEMWEKWIMLASLGAATCLMRGNVGEIEAAPGGADLAPRILAECSAIAAANGFVGGDAFLLRTQKTLTLRGSALTSSMYRDMGKNARVEADQILGDFLARRCDVDAPLVQAAFANLSIYQARLGAR